MTHQIAGVLNIDKPGGMTSHDVVNRVRRLAGTRRVGHAGTLDPMATGVLLVCVGTATRIAEYLQAGRKTYRAEICLGVSTDTYDAEGDILTTNPVPDLSLDQIVETLAAFTGEIKQTPPMYSALKVQGQSLHRLARSGIEVEREARDVTVFDMTAESWRTPHLTLTLTCTPGFYVRSLAFDLGQAWGCGGHLSGLRRLASGGWRVQDAVPLDELLASGENWQDYLHGLAASLSMLPALILAEDEAVRFAQGQRIAISGDSAGEMRVFSPSERLVGIGMLDAENGILSPHKVFDSP
ncbi:MAG: tRNA pseudouridine(55) synthase TruB [Caldilineales bacterium]|nr:tRNA pseudouridine(55) synthase TruB [Caldilineales bacterium]